jgi:transposase
MAMMRKVSEVASMLCPKCGGTMKVVVFLTEYAFVDRIISHLKLAFVAERPPPPQFAFQEYLLATDPTVEYFS